MMTAQGGKVRRWREEANRKKTHGRGQQCGDCGGEAGKGVVPEVNDNGKNTIKKKSKEQQGNQKSE